MSTITAKRIYLKDNNDTVLVPHAAAGVVESTTHKIVSIVRCTRAEYESMRAAGTLEANTNYCITDIIPIGSVFMFPLATLDGYILCDGSAISRTDYADLFAVIGTTFGAGDGSTTFNVPDLVDSGSTINYFIKY